MNGNAGNPRFFLQIRQKNANFSTPNRDKIEGNGMKFFVFRLRPTLFAAGLALLLGVSAGTAYAAGAEEVYWSGARSLPVYSVEREDNKVALTFDCAWGVEHTDAILDCLAEEKVRVTFFAVEFWVEKYPEYVKKIVDAGHEIGTHSATHSYMSRLSEEEIKQELESSSAAIEKAGGKQVDLFRAPYGDYDDLLIDTANAMGLLPVQWDVDSLDWKDLSASDIAARITERTKSGSIILMHNNGLHTAEALPIILSALRAKGFSFVPVGELVYRENYTIDASGRQIPKNTA